MTTTCNSYIHEYSFFDDVFDCLNEAVKDVTVAVGRYDMKKHQLESKMMFESSRDTDYEVMLEAEGEGVLAKIGKAVLKIIAKIDEFIKKITGKITDNIKLGKSDEEKVNQILTQHPELKDQIIEGIDKEWFTVADVAKFEKDVIGLIHMLEKNAIDHQTFMDRFKAKCKAFTDSASPILGAATTVVGFMKIIPDVHKAAKGTKEALSSFRGTLDKFHQDIETNYGKQDVSKVQAIMNALSQAIGLTTKECQEQTANQGRLRSIFKRITGKDMINNNNPKKIAAADATRARLKAEDDAAQIEANRKAEMEHIAKRELKNKYPQDFQRNGGKGRGRGNP